MLFVGATMGKKRTGAAANGGLAPAQFPVTVLTPATGKTERFTFRLVIISLQAALLFRNLNLKF